MNFNITHYSPTISSRQNPHIKRLLHLQKVPQRRKQEAFLIEGIREISRAHQAKVVFEICYYCESFVKKPEAFELIHIFQAENLPLQGLSVSVFQAVSGRQNPDGLLVIAKQWDMELGKIQPGPNPLFMVAEGIEKPGNLGALIRCAESAHIDGLILVDGVADVFSPHVIRNSQGALFSIPIAQASFEDTIAFLSQHQAKVVTTMPQAPSIYWDIPLSGPLAIVLGCEQSGLTERWHTISDLSIRIPQYGKSDSLNLAIAGILVLYEALRQRR